jgi:hypothetical protein
MRLNIVSWYPEEMREKYHHYRYRILLFWLWDFFRDNAREETGILQETRADEAGVWGKGRQRRSFYWVCLDSDRIRDSLDSLGDYGEENLLTVKAQPTFATQRNPSDAL